MSEHTISQTHTAHGHMHDTHDDFLLRFRKNLFIEIMGVFSFLNISRIFLTALIMDSIFFAQEFKLFLEVLSILIPPLLIYLVATYLTHIPHSVAVILFLVSSVFSFQYPSRLKIVYGILGLSVIIGLFSSLLV